MSGLVVQCRACRALVVVDRLVVDGNDAGQAGLPCSSCNAVNWLPVHASAHVANAAAPIVTTFTTSPPALPPVSLPPAMPAAAIVPVQAAPIAAPSSWDGAARARIDDKLAPPNDEQQLLAERFERLLDGAWQNDGEHKQLLKAAAASDQLAFVGARYRAVLDVVRDEPKARAMQQELLTLAMATMKPTATSTEPRSSTATLLKVGFGLAVIAAIVMGGIFASRFLSRGLTAMSPPDASSE